MRKLLILSGLILMMLAALGAAACTSDATTLAPPTPAAPVSAPAKAAPAPAGAEEMAKAAEEVSKAAEEMAKAEAAPAPAEAAPAPSRPKGGVFRRLWSDPPTLDPHLTGDTTSAGIVVEIFSGLVALNTDLELVPDIAERYSISEDGLTYTFYLRPNAKFHDGKTVTAQDFKWSFERAASLLTGSPVADTYLGDIIGVRDVLNGRAKEISGIKVIDSHTLEVRIDAPKAYFLAKMTYPTAFVVDRENVEKGGDNWFDKPNGTGPFKLKEYRIGERIVLERNDLYYREPAHLDSVVMNLAGGQAMAMYENDEIDITGVGLLDLERVLDPNEKLNKDLIVAPPEFSVSYIGLNLTMPPFDDLKFRQALNYAIDKELIAKEVLSDLVVPAYGILPPGFPGFNPDLKGLKYDPDKAKLLLGQSKYADPATRPRIVITVPGSGGSPGLDLEVILEMWRQTLGVEVEVQQVEWATYLRDLNQARFQAFGGLGWEADYPDPQDFLDVLFYSKSELNHGQYANAAVDRLLEQAGIEQNINQRVELYHQAEDLIVEDAAWVPLWFTGDHHVLVKPHIKGYKPTAMTVPKLREIYLEE